MTNARCNTPVKEAQPCTPTPRKWAAPLTMRRKCAPSVFTKLQGIHPLGGTVKPFKQKSRHTPHCFCVIAVSNKRRKEASRDRSTRPSAGERVCCLFTPASKLKDCFFKPWGWGVGVGRGNATHFRRFGLRRRSDQISFSFRNVQVYNLRLYQ